MIGIFLAAIGGGLVAGLMVSAAVACTSLFLLRPVDELADEVDQLAGELAGDVDELARRRP